MYNQTMKNISAKAQPLFENLIIFALIAIIAMGVYKLVLKWTHKEPVRQTAKIHKAIEAPSKELCSFMMKQCQGKY